MQKPKRILILINQKTSSTDRNWAFFRNSVARSMGEDVEIVMGELASLSFEINADGMQVYDKQRGWSVGDFDLVVFRIIRSAIALASSVAGYLQANNIPYVDQQFQPRPYSKYSAQVLRYINGILPIPSYYALQPVLKAAIEQDEIPFGYPMIIKDNNGRKGRLNFIAHTKEEALEILDQNPDVDFIVQAFIKNEGDYRILVIGGEVKLAIYRHASGNSHLNNTSQGATAETVPVDHIDPLVLDDVKKAVALERLQIAGADLMFDSVTGQHYILEVNSSPQLASGAVVEQKLAAYTDYLRELLNGKEIR